MDNFANILQYGSVNGPGGISTRASIPLNAIDRAKEDEVVLKPFEHIHKVPSKYHKSMVEVFNHWLKVPEDKLKEIKEIIHILHTATLLIDDMQDDSKVRYGVPAAHVAHSVGLTLNAASHAMYIAFKKIIALRNPAATKIYLETTLDVHRGQGIELYWRDIYLCPTEAEYIDMVKQKTAGMFVLCVQLLQAFSDNKENYIGIAVLIGVYYAVRDDYCNLFNQAGLKTLGENPIDQQSDSDITDGKFTLPMIHAIQSPGSAEECIDILKLRTSDSKLIKRFISLLREHGSDVYTEEILRRLERDIEKEICRLGGNPKLSALVKELRNWRRGEELQ